jgi:hypothetical protein
VYLQSDAGFLLQSSRARIGAALRDLGLQRWAVPVMLWCARFEGASAWMDEPRLVPERGVLTALRMCRSRRSRGNLFSHDPQIARTIAELPLGRIHAKWPAWTSPRGLTERWCPLGERFVEFAGRYPRATGLVVWEGTVPAVAAEEAAQWLMQQMRQQMR